MSRAWVSKTPCRDLRWLGMPKDMPIPTVVFTEEDHCSGYQIKPSSDVVEVGPAEIQSLWGILVVCEATGSEGGTLAHEHRHFQQDLMGCDYDGLGWPISPSSGYRQDIVRYFRESRMEADALRFELLKCPSETTLEWLDWIQEEAAS